MFAYSLAEFEIGKPKPLIEMLRHNDIRNALRESFDDDNLSILKISVARMMDWSKIGDDVRELGLDPESEFETFYEIFNKVVDRSRSPATARQEQKIDTLITGQQQLLEKVISSPVSFSDMEAISNLISGDTLAQFEQMRAKWKNGKRDEVIVWLKDLKGNNARWSVLSSEAKARVLVFEARLELDIDGSLDRVRELAAEARGLVPDLPQIRLQALIACRQNGAESGLSLQDDAEDIDSLNLKMGWI